MRVGWKESTQTIHANRHARRRIRLRAMVAPVQGLRCEGEQILPTRWGFSRERRALSPDEHVRRCLAPVHRELRRVICSEHHGHAEREEKEAAHEPRCTQFNANAPGV